MKKRLILLVALSVCFGHGTSLLACGGADDNHEAWHDQYDKWPTEVKFVVYGLTASVMALSGAKAISMVMDAGRHYVKPTMVTPHVIRLTPNQAPLTLTPSSSSPVQAPAELSRIADNE